MRNIDIQNTVDKIKSLGEKKLPIQLSLIASRNKRILEEAAADIDAKRLEIVKEYAEKDENGEVKTDEKGNARIQDASGFTADLQELYESELDLQLEKITEEDLAKCEGEKYDSLTMEEVSALAFMIEG